MLHACNLYVGIYQMAVEWLQGEAVELSLHLVNNRRTNLQHYNPLANEVGALMVVGDVDEADARDIVVRSINAYFQRVYPLHSAYAPLHYIFIFLDGHNIWHDNIPLNGFQWDGSGFIHDDKNVIGGKHGSVCVTCFNFTRTCCSIVSTRNGFCELEGFYNNSLLTCMHVLNRIA